MTRPRPTTFLPPAVVLLVTVCMQQVSSFLPSPRHGSTISTSALHGINDWRDLMFDYAPGASSASASSPLEASLSPPRPVNVLPFPFDQILLQGETKQLRLYEDRFIKLFDDTQENHGGVVAMGLLATNGIVQKVPLCEIEAYNKMDEFGIFVTIRAVGRAELLDIQKQEPYIQAVCREISDIVPPNLELPNLLAQQIEDTVGVVSKMEVALEQVDEKTDKDVLSKLSRAKLVSIHWG